MTSVVNPSDLFSHKRFIKHWIYKCIMNVLFSIGLQKTKQKNTCLIQSDGTINKYTQPDRVFCPVLSNAQDLDLKKTNQKQIKHH